MPRRAPYVAACSAIAVSLALAACGQGQSDLGKSPAIGRSGDQPKAAQELGFPQFATKNTTRVGGADPTADAAAVAQAVFTPELPSARPRAVTLVDSGDWQAGVAASVLMSPPLRAPILLSGSDSLPDATKNALSALSPTGARPIGGAQVVRVGAVPAPSGLRSTQVAGTNPFAIAAGVDRLVARTTGKPSDIVVVASGERAEFAMPAAAWAAKAGDPVLFVTRNAIPPETRRALTLHQQPKIYLLGPPDVVSAGVEKLLRGLGTVKRISGPDAVSNAIAFARYSDGSFGWNVVDPGHGLVFANDQRPLDAAAASPLSASGKYGPLLLVDQPSPLPPALIQYLLDIEPGYEKDPTRGVYNHGWLLGDASAISVGDQARIDTLLEIAPVANAQQQTTTPAKPSTPKKKKKIHHVDDAEQDHDHHDDDAQTVSEAENPARVKTDREVSVDDVRQLMGASTPHFALQLRNRIAKLIRGLPPEHPARIEGEREIERLDGLAFRGETRGDVEPGDLDPLPSLTDHPA